jgi:NADPH:quinone reductase-like Zn-dependent oxidoreductase
MSLPSPIQAWCLPVDEESWNSHKQLRLRDVKLSPPEKGEVLVKLHATSVNFRQVIIV